MADDAPTTEEQNQKPKLPLKMLLIILGIFLLEGGAISMFWVLRGGSPKLAEATNPIEQTQQTPGKDVAEVILAESFSVDNYPGGRARIIVTLEVAAKVEKGNKNRLTLLVKEHKTEIMDNIRSLVSSAQPEHLKDPQLQVIKRKIKAGMEKIVGEGLIEEILLPTWKSYAQD